MDTTTTTTHSCLHTAEAPTTEGHEVGERWVCACGDHFVYREGFNRGGYPELAWWPAPAVPQPRKARASRGLLFGPRKG